MEVTQGKEHLVPVTSISKEQTGVFSQDAFQPGKQSWLA
jgi:hypothetical protein